MEGDNVIEGKNVIKRGQTDKQAQSVSQSESASCVCVFLPTFYSLAPETTVRMTAEREKRWGRVVRRQEELWQSGIQFIYLRCFD